MASSRSQKPRVSSTIWSSRAEDMGVVLRELAHAHDAVQRAVRLVAVAAAELGEPQRQVAIGVDALLEDQDVRRAVHRLQRHQVAGAANTGLRPDRCRASRRGRRTYSRGYLPQWPDCLPLARVHQLRRLDLDDSRPRRAGGAYRLRAAARSCSPWGARRPSRAPRSGGGTGPSPGRSCDGRAWPPPPAAARCASSCFLLSQPVP